RFIPRRKKIFDGITSFLMVVLLVIIVVILGITCWKERNIELDFKFFSQLRSAKESNQIIRGDRIIISFSGPVQIESVKRNLVIEPLLDFEGDWINNHQLQLIIKDDLTPDFNYRLKIRNFKSKWGVPNQEKEVVFSTDPLPKLKSIYPVEGQTEVEVQGAITFEFEEPLASQYYLKIKTDPVFEFEDVKTKDKNKIVIKPATNLSFDAEYHLTAEIRSRNYFDFSRKVAEVSFKTEKPPVVIYGLDSNGVPTKTRNRLKLAEPKIMVGKYIDIDLSEQNLYIFENGRELGAYKVSTGLRGMDTPAGEFKIMARYFRPWSAKYGLFMPWFIQFTNQGHGIHELPEWPGGYKEGANHLGIPVSHGCVRLGVGPAKLVYDFAEIGTVLVIHY
ncbi:MAG: L,D-transpeptidase family protein, partial [Candidatus Moranbacteria bacterium]|nr:L,D-transpeptidase family protein [Candidatus Moranbacteria bacterium]